MTYWITDEGKVERDADTGEPLKRPEGINTPCQHCAKPPKWAKAAGKTDDELRALAEDATDQTCQAWEYYNQCAGVGRFPDDPIVMWYAGVFRELELEWKRKPAQDSNHAVQLLCALFMKANAG